MNKALFSSERTDWETPYKIFQKYDDRYQFDIDVCALPHNAKLPRYWTPEQNALEQDWSDLRCWMNPPYGRSIISAWVEKACSAKLCVGLLPGRTDTQWFHKWVYPYAELEFLPGRISFVGAKHSAPFPSIIAIWGRQ